MTVLFWIIGAVAFYPLVCWLDDRAAAKRDREYTGRKVAR